MDFSRFILGEGNLLDSLLYRFGPEGEILNCDPEASTLPIDQLELIEFDQGWQLRWQGGTGDVQTTDGFRIYGDGQLLGTSHSRTFQLSQLEQGSQIAFKVEAFKGEMVTAASETFHLSVPEKTMGYRRSFILHDPQQEDHWLGFALTNPQTRSLFVSLVTRDVSGQKLAIIAYGALAPGEKRLALFSHLFDQELRDQTHILDIVCDKEPMVFVLKGRPGSVSGTSGNYPQKSGIQFMPFFSGYDIEFRIFAPESADVNLQGLDLEGNLLAETTLATQAGVFRMSPTELFERELPELSRIKWQSEVPLIVNQTRGAAVLQEHSYQELNAPEQYNLQGSLMALSNIFGHVYIDNPNPHRTWIKFQTYDAMGRLQGAMSLEMKPGESRSYSLAYLIASSSSDAQVVHFQASAPIQVKSSIAQHLNANAIENVPLRSLIRAEALPAAIRFGSRFVIPHAPANEIWTTQIVVANRSEQPILVNFRAKDSAGNSLGSKPIRLEARAFFFEDTRDLFGFANEVASLEITGPDDADLVTWVFYQTMTPKELAGIVVPPIP